MSERQYMDCRECGKLGYHTNKAGCILAVQAAQAAMEEVQAARAAMDQRDVWCGDIAVHDPHGTCPGKTFPGVAEKPMTPEIPKQVTSEVVMQSYKAVEELAKALREKAEAGWGEWGAIRCLESAMYDLWGAYGYLAIEEGLIVRGRDS